VKKLGGGWLEIGCATILLGIKSLAPGVIVPKNLPRALKSPSSLAESISCPRA
jgi:hypothetical protein